MDDHSCVQVINKVRSYRVDTKLITKLASEICERLAVHHYEVCIQFVGPTAMRKLNKQYRAKDKSTDVLSFPQYAWKSPLKVHVGKIASKKRLIMNPMPLGDVVISLDDAKNNALGSGHGLDYEVLFLMIHGILHLVGHDHMKPAEKRRMFNEQKKLIACFMPAASKIPLWTRCVRPVKKGR